MPPRRRAEATSKRRPAIPVPAKNSLFDKQNSLFSEEQGIRCKPLNLFGDRRQKPLKETEWG